jgi:single-strand DNA-binding protein
MNKLMIIGNVGKDPVVNTVNGKQVANFSVGVSKKSKGENQTTWFDVALWEKAGVYPYIKKGSHVYVEGEVSVRTYDKKDGGQGVSLNITAFQIELLGGRSAQAEQTQAEQPNDLPF